jgi:hypothetical protein
MKRNPARMRYKNDSRSAQLCYLSIVCDVAYFIAVYASTKIIPDMWMGADVILNILFMLIVFWGSEMLKVYDRRWPFIIAALGSVQILRVFWLPIKYRELEQLMGTSFTFVCASLALSGLFLFAAAMYSRFNSQLLNNYLKSEKAKG